MHFVQLWQKVVRLILGRPCEVLHPSIHPFNVWITFGYFMLFFSSKRFPIPRRILWFPFLPSRPLSSFSSPNISSKNGTTFPERFTPVMQSEQPSPGGLYSGKPQLLLWSETLSMVVLSVTSIGVWSPEKEFFIKMKRRWIEQRKNASKLKQD